MNVFTCRFNYHFILTLVSVLVLCAGKVSSQPYIVSSGGLGQYGYIEKNASATNFLLNSDTYSNIYQLFARSYISSNVLTYGTAVNICGSTTNVNQSTDNYNFGTLNAGDVIYSSVHADYCGGSNSYSSNPNTTGFNERSFYVMDFVGQTDALVSSANYNSLNANVVLTFTLSNNNTSGQALNRLWLVNDGTAAEGTDILNSAFELYYENATGSETFNGNESHATLYGDYNGNPTSNNVYGHDALNISIPQNTTGGLRCYVVLKGTSAFLNPSAKTKTVLMSVIADGISITPDRDTNHSLLKIDKTTPSASAITIADQAFITAQAGDWNTGTTWVGGVVPTADASVTVAHTITLNSAVTNAPYSLVINSSSGITFGASSTITVNQTVTNNGAIDMTNGGTLTIASGGTLANGTNTFTPGTGTVVFPGTGTVTGTITFNDVNIAGAVDFGPTASLNGTLRINPGGFVNINSPAYNSSSRLQYYVGGAYNRDVEWSQTSGNAYPYNVQISGATTLYTNNAGANILRQIAGNLTIDAGCVLDMGNMTAGGIVVLGDIINNGTLLMSGSSVHLKCKNFSNGPSNPLAATTLASLSGGDLELSGDFTDNAIFTPNSRAVFFSGASGNQTITKTGGEIFDYILVQKAAGNVLLANDITVNQVLTLTSGLITTGAYKVIISSNLPAAIGSASSSSYINGSLRRSIAPGINTYLFPLGTSAAYAPVTLDFLAGTTTGFLDAFTTNGDHSSVASSALNGNNSVNRTWTFSIYSGLATVGYNSTFNWVSADQDAGFVAASSKVGRFASGWTLPGVNSYPTSTSIKVNGLTAFGDFQIANDCVYPAINPISTTVCSGAPFSVTPVNVTNGVVPAGTTYNWSNPAGAGFTGGAGSSGTPVNVSGTLVNTTLLPVTATYTVTPLAGTCTGPDFTVTVTVDPVSVGGASAAAASSVCTGSGTSVTVSGYTGTIQWQQSADGSTGWANVTGGSGATTSTYTTPNLSASTWYRAVVSSGICTSANSTTASVTVNPLSVGGTAAATNATVCSGSNTTITLSGYTGTIQWQQSADGSTGWANVTGGSGATTNSYTTPGLTTATWYRAVVTSGMCSAANSSTASVAVTPLNFGGTATAVTSTALPGSICTGNSTTVTVAGYTGTIQWQQSANGSSGWANVTGGSGATSAVYTTPNLTVATWYRAAVTSGSCTAYSSVAQILISATSVPGTATVASSPICSGATTSLTLSGYSGTILWVYSLNGSSQAGQALPLPNTNATFNTPTLLNTIWYRARVSNGACFTYTPWLQVDIQAAVSAITPVPATSPCPNVSGLKYSVTAIAGTTYAWTVPPGWTITSGQGSNIIFVTSGSFGQDGTIDVTATNACGTTSSTLAVTVLGAPAASITSNFCISPGNIVLTAHPDAGCTYSWSTGATTQSITVSVAGNYTATLKDNTTLCSTSVTPTVANELVTNGNFDLENVGFTTLYTYKADIDGVNDELVPEATYGIGNNPQNYHSQYWGRDHTSNSGNFMIVNGVANSVVWTESNITVEPNKTYYFSAWGISLSGNPNRAILRFRVNNVQVGSTVTLPAGPSNNNPPYNWQQFYGTWTAGPTTTTATIDIIDLQTSDIGNDFGLDDISFGTLQPTFITPNVSANGGAPVCAGETVDLSVSISGGLPDIHYSWTGPNGFTSSAQNPSIANVTAANDGDYTVVITDGYGCATPIISATAHVTVRPMPTATVSGASSQCKDAAVPNVTFTGAGSTAPYTFTYNINGAADVSTSTLSGNSRSLPVPSGTAGDFTYTITGVTDANGCSQPQTSAALFSFRDVAATISGTTAVCMGATAPEITFIGSGWRSVAPYTFTYKINGGANLTATTVADKCISIPAPTGVDGTFVYSLVSVADASGCSFPASGSATITVYPPPVITGNNSDCYNDVGIVYTTEPGMTGYTWTITGGTITAGAGTNSVTVNWATTYNSSISVTYVNTHGCSASTPTTYNVVVGNMWLGLTSDWNDGSNWCQGVPVSTTDVVISTAPNQPQITNTLAVCRNLTINGPTASLTINAGQALTVNSNLANNGGTFVINSDALNNNGSLIVNGTSTGNVIYNRYLETNRWHITSPSVNNSMSLNGSTIDVIGGTYNFSPYIESGNSGWTYPYATLPGTLTPGMGYLIKLLSGNSVRYTGTVNGDVTLSLPSSSTNTGWNAIGNPYTSALRISDESGYSGFITQNTSTLDPNYQAVYLWNQTGSYSSTEQYYNVICNVGYIGKHYGGILAEKYVQAGQGFLVNLKYNGGANGIINFRKGSAAPNGLQVNSTSTTTLKASQSSWSGITLLASHKGRTCSSVVAFNSNMTNGLDPSYDVGLLSATDFNLYSRLLSGDNQTNFTIQCLPENWTDDLVVPIGLDFAQAGTVTFKASGIILPKGMYPVLEDRQLKVSAPLQYDTDSLTVEISEPVWGTGRFYLHFGGANITTGNGSKPESSPLSAFYNNGIIRIFGLPETNSRAWLYDLGGRKLTNEYRLTSTNQNEIPATGLASGVYLLRIEGKSNRQTIKITVLSQ